MNIVNLLFGLDGRINRKQFWIGIAIIAGVEILIFLALGVSLLPEDTASGRTRTIHAIVQLLTLYPLVAIAVKRLHDRDQPAAWAGVIVAITLISTVIDFLGLADNPNTMGTSMLIFGAVVLVIGLAFLIELGFRRGTVGPNQYGPAPAVAAS